MCARRQGPRLKPSRVRRRMVESFRVSPGVTCKQNAWALPIHLPHWKPHRKMPAPPPRRDPLRQGKAKAPPSNWAAATKSLAALAPHQNHLFPSHPFPLLFSLPPPPLPSSPAQALTAISCTSYPQSTASSCPDTSLVGQRVRGANHQTPRTVFSPLLLNRPDRVCPACDSFIAAITPLPFSRHRPNTSRFPFSIRF